MTSHGRRAGALLFAAGLVAGTLAAAGCGREAPGHLLVTSGFTDRIFVLDARSGAVIDSVTLDPRPGERDEPHAVAVAPDGRHWYATVSHGEPTLWKFETDGNRLVGRVNLPTRGASRVRLSPDGAWATVPDYWRSGGGVVSQVALVRTEDLVVTAVRDVCPAPHDAVFSPDGRRLAVTCALGRELVVLDAATLEPLERHGVAERDGAKPMNAAWSADGRRVTVSLMGRASLAEVRIGEAEVAEVAGDANAALAAAHAPSPLLTDALRGHPVQLERRPDGSVVVALRDAGEVAVVDSDGTVRTRIAIPGPNPHGVALDPSGETAFVTYEGTPGTPGGVVAVDLREGRVRWHTPVGSYTLGVAWLPEA